MGFNRPYVLSPKETKSMKLQALDPVVQNLTKFIAKVTLKFLS